MIPRLWVSGYIGRADQYYRVYPIMLLSPLLVRDPLLDATAAALAPQVTLAYPATQAGSSRTSAICG